MCFRLLSRSRADCGEPLSAHLLTSLALTAFSSFAQRDASQYHAAAQTAPPSASASAAASASSSSSSSSQSSTLAPRAPIATLCIHSRKFAFVSIGASASILLVVQCARSDSDAHARACVRVVERLVYFHCGATAFDEADDNEEQGSGESEAGSALEAALPFIDSYLARHDIATVRSCLTRVSISTVGRGTLCLSARVYPD